jgi:hypothetical protein
MHIVWLLPQNEIIIINDATSKAAPKAIGPFSVMHTHNNGAITFHHSNVMEKIIIN